MLMPPMIIMTSSEGAETVSFGDATFTLIEVEKKLEKPELERIQVEHFRKLAQALRPDLAVEIVSPGDRPDFIVKRGAESFGLDVTELAFTKRRSSAFQFGRFKDDLRRAHDDGRLRGCKGAHIEVFALPPGSPWIKVQAPILNELIDTFETLTIDFDVWNATDVMSPMPDFGMPIEGTTSDGSVQWMVCGSARAPNSFVRSCGFQVEHAYRHHVTEQDVRARIDELVDGHDDPSQKIDELVIVAGGPDRYGDGLADEALLAHMFAEKWKGEISSPKSIRRVILTNWQANRIHVLYPAETQN